MEIKKSFCAALFVFLQKRNIHNLIEIFSPLASRNLALLMIIKEVQCLQSEWLPARDVIP